MTKRRKDDRQVSMFVPAPMPAPSSRPRSEMPAAAPAPLPDDQPPQVRLVPPPRPIQDEVIVEPLDDGRFEVLMLRHDGTTRIGVRYTRDQLVQLISRAKGALEIA